MKSTREDRLIPAPRRRDILTYGASLALLPSVSWAACTRDTSCLAIGYCGEALDIAKAVAADRLLAGEASLAGAVRITVNGLVDNTVGLAHVGIRSAELHIGFPNTGGDPTGVEFLAWRHQLLPVENAGAPIAFTVPVENTLNLAVDIETLGTERHETVLSIGREPGQPKLRTGHYLIALGASNFHPQRSGGDRSEPMISLSVETL